MDRKAENRDTHSCLMNHIYNNNSLAFPLSYLLAFGIVKHSQLLTSTRRKSLRSQSPWKMQFRSIDVQYAQIKWAKPLRVSRLFLWGYSHIKEVIKLHNSPLWKVLLADHLKQVCLPSKRQVKQIKLNQNGTSHLSLVWTRYIGVTACKHLFTALLVEIP